MTLTISGTSKSQGSSQIHPTFEGNAEDMQTTNCCFGRDERTRQKQLPFSKKPDAEVHTIHAVIAFESKHEYLI
jgi:hypothetical protein